MKKDHLFLLGLLQRLRCILVAGSHLGHDAEDDFWGDEEGDSGPETELLNTSPGDGTLMTPSSSHSQLGLTLNLLPNLSVT